MVRLALELSLYQFASMLRSGPRMYPFMLAKMHELQGQPPSVWLPEYLEGIAHHRVTSQEEDDIG